MNFLVELDVFSGPLDLLLYLVRRHEVEITEIPVAPITEQFLEYLTVLEQLDVDAVGDFLEVASTLIEIKSRLLLPHSEEVDEPLDDPRRELVERLLEYKKFKDAATILEERSRHWQQRFPRLADDVPVRKRDAADDPIREVELWDLVSAFGRILRQRDAARPSSIVYDETPIHVYTAQIEVRLRERGVVAFSDLFQPDQHKSVVVGLFFAVLELVRHHGVRVEQQELHGEIWILAALAEPEESSEGPQNGTIGLHEPE
jgi:segregation and condensation protein A